MRSFASRHLTRALLLGLLVAFSLAWPALAAEKRKKPKQNGVESAGMYSNYVDKGQSAFDQYLGDTVAHRIRTGTGLAVRHRPVVQISAADFRTGNLSRSAREAAELACTSKCGVLATYQPGEGIFLDEAPQTRNQPVRSFRAVARTGALRAGAQSRTRRRQALRALVLPRDRAYAIQKSFLMLVGSPVRVGFHANKSTCDDMSQ